MEKYTKRQIVLNLFRTGRRFFAAELNKEAGFNDARKVISILRRKGFVISDLRLEDGRKMYWLSSCDTQLSLFN